MHRNPATMRRWTKKKVMRRACLTVQKANGGDSRCGPLLQILHGGGSEHRYAVSLRDKGVMGADQVEEIRQRTVQDES